MVATSSSPTKHCATTLPLLVGKDRPSHTVPSPTLTQRTSRFSIFWRRSFLAGRNTGYPRPRSSSHRHPRPAADHVEASRLQSAAHVGQSGDVRAGPRKACHRPVPMRIRDRRRHLPRGAAQCTTPPTYAIAITRCRARPSESASSTSWAAQPAGPQAWCPARTYARRRRCADT
jgi:hypothetical protein